MDKESEKKMVREMAEAIWKSQGEQGYYPNRMDLALEVVRKYPHLVAKVCPECVGFGEVCVGYVNDHTGILTPAEQMEDCKLCHGHGVVSLKIDEKGGER